jgi:Protein of unknown function (DUF2786)
MLAMRDLRSIIRIIDALLAKTVARGATPGEAAAALAKAEEIASRHGVDLSRRSADRGEARERARQQAAWAEEARRR